MTVKPIAAGMPQRIIQKINELVNAVNTGGGGSGSGTADTILDGATVADAGKALGINAQGAPALISAGAPILRCNLTYTGAGTQAAPYVGHLDHASELVDALDTESSYNPLIVIAYAFNDDPNQTLPAVVQYITGQDEEETFTYSKLSCYGDRIRTTVANVLMIDSEVVDGVRTFTINDKIASIAAATGNIVDNVLVYNASN